MITKWFLEHCQGLGTCLRLSDGSVLAKELEQASWVYLHSFLPTRQRKELNQTVETSGKKAKNKDVLLILTGL